MKHFDEQAIKDLEFDLIRLMLHDYCIGPSARLRMIELEPLSDFELLKAELMRSEEFTHIRRDGISFPALDFEEMEEEIQLLEIRDSVLNEDGFFRIYKANVLVNDIIKSFTGLEAVFTSLYALLGDVYESDEIIKAIQTVFDGKWKVKF